MTEAGSERCYVAEFEDGVGVHESMNVGDL